MKKSSFLSRRRFLRGIGGVAVGLPFLESVASRTAEAQATGDPRRLIVFFECNGVNMSRFFPATAFGALTDASFTGRSIEPLLPYKDKLLIPRGIHMAPRGYGRDGGAGDDHAKGMGHKLTCQLLEDTNDKYAMGPSVDQVLAQEINPPGRESMTLLVGGKRNGVLGHISYRGRAQPVTGENNPWLAYQDFMGLNAGDNEAAERVLRRRQSVLDLVSGEMEALKSAGLSKIDVDKLDMHFTSIRELEQVAGNTGLIACTLDPTVAQELEGLNPDTIGNDSEYRHIGRLQMDVLALAIACDYTRVGTLQWGSGAGGPIFRWDGISHDYNHHKISHGSTTDSGGDGSLAGYENMLYDIDRWYADRYKYLLDRLSSYSEGSGTVLDNSAVVWVNELSDGREHNFMDLPFVIAGSCGGYFKQGQYIKVTNQSNLKNDVDAPHNKLLTMFMRACGVQTDMFGAFGQPGEFDQLKA